MKNIKGYIYILLAAVLWGLIGPVSKIAFDNGASATEIGFYRAVLSWFIFATHAVVTRKTKAEIKDIPVMVIFGVVGVSFFYTVFLVSVEKGGAAFAAVLLYTAPAWVAVISPFIYKDRLTINKGVAIILTITGVAGICLNGNSGDVYGMKFDTIAIIAGLLSGLAYSMYYIFGKYFTSKYESSTLFLYILPVGAIGLLPFVEFTDKSIETWITLLFIGFICSYGANSFYYMGLKHLQPTKAVLTATFEPLAAALFAYFIWNEQFSAAGYGGAFLILIGVVITVFDKNQESE